MPLSEWESRTVRVRANRQRIHVRIAGSSGPMMLLCHGFPESWYSWRHQLDVLASSGFRAVAMDMRGYGRSSKPTEAAAYRITEIVGDCLGVVEALGESTAVIVGHDYGAPVAWTAAWTRPDVFRAVVGLSVPFGGRGLAGLPGSPFGELRPSVAYRELAGPDMLFYQEYFSRPGDVAAREVEEDVRAWLTAGLYSMSADRPLPPELAGVDLTSLPDGMLREFVRGAMCVPLGSTFAGLLQLPEKLPAWLSEEDLDFYVSEFEHGGLTAPLSYYRNTELDWEVLGQHQGKPITVPAMFRGGDRDVATIWSQHARARESEAHTDLRGSIILRNCGHWIMQEQPDAVNKELLVFLQGLSWGRQGRFWKSGVNALCDLTSCDQHLTFGDRGRLTHRPDDHRVALEERRLCQANRIDTPTVSSAIAATEIGCGRPLCCHDLIRASPPTKMVESATVTARDCSTRPS
jgi:pimeloyl-ACP methyl ester carboxylesterase